MNLNNNNSNLQAYKDEVVLTEFIKPIKQYLWFITLISILVGCITMTYLSLLNPLYRSTALLQISNAAPYHELMGDKKGRVTLDKKTQFQLMRSREFIKDVVNEFALTTNSAFNLGKYSTDYRSIKNTNPVMSIDAAIAKVLAGLEISPIVGTDLVKLSFTSYDAELSMKLANHIGQTYATYQNNLFNFTQKKNNQWLLDKLTKLGKAVESSEAKLQNFQEENGIVDILGLVGLVSNEISQISAAMIKIEKVIDERKVKIEFINKHPNDVNALSTLPDIYEHAKFRQLMNLEETLTIKLTQRFGPKHPELISLRDDLALVKTQIKAQVNASVARIKANYLVSLDELKILKSRLVKAKEKYLRLSRLKTTFSQLSREVKTNKELYNTYLLKMKEVDLLGSHHQSFNINMIDEAVSAKALILPKKNLFIALAFITTFMLLSAIVVVKELMSDTLNASHKLETFIEAAIIGILPKVKAIGKTRAEKVFNDVHFNEAISSLRASILFNHSTVSPKIIGITSSDSGEGKSTVALQLAKSFAQLEKVLLIEADLRNPSLAKYLNFNPHRPGLSNLLAQTHETEDCLIKDYQRQLDILSSGLAPSNPLMFLSMKRFAWLLKDFSQHYDRIIIETPPVNVVSDALIVSKLVDSVLYVVNSGKTKRESIIAGLKTLKHINAPVNGIVLNNSQFLDKKIYQNKYYKKKAKNIKLAPRKLVS